MNLANTSAEKLVAIRERCCEIAREQFPDADAIQVGLYSGTFRVEVKHGREWALYVVPDDLLTDAAIKGEAAEKIAEDLAAKRREAARKAVETRRRRQAEQRFAAMSQDEFDRTREQEDLTDDDLTAAGDTGLTIGDGVEQLGLEVVA